MIRRNGECDKVLGALALITYVVNITVLCIGLKIVMCLNNLNDPLWFSWVLCSTCWIDQE